MCLICEFNDEADDSRYAWERRQAEMLVVLIKMLKHEGDTPGHIEEGLANRGFSRVEIKLMRAPVLLALAELIDHGLVDVGPMAVH